MTERTLVRETEYGQITKTVRSCFFCDHMYLILSKKFCHLLQRDIDLFPTIQADCPLPIREDRLTEKLCEVRNEDTPVG